MSVDAKLQRLSKRLGVRVLGVGSGRGAAPDIVVAGGPPGVRA